MASLVVLVACLGAGAILRRRVEVGPLTTYVLYVALPALALLSVRRATGVSLWSVGSVWLVFAAAALGFAALGRLRGWDRATVGCLVLSCGLSNTSFVGFPLLEVLRGPQALPIAVPLDQLGSFLIVATVAPAVGALARGSADSASPATVVRDVLVRALRFPALWALVLGLATRAAALPTPIEGALERIAATLSPVALFAVGAQLAPPPKAAREPLALGLVFKLGLAPLLVWSWARAGGLHDLVLEVTVLEAAMGPMVTGAVLAQAYGLRPELAAALLGAGIPLSLLTVWGWSVLLR